MLCVLLEYETVGPDFKKQLSNIRMVITQPSHSDTGPFNMGALIHISCVVFT